MADVTIIEGFKIKDSRARKMIENLYFDNVAEMKASEELSAGQIIKTLGYYSINDNGSALYKVRTKTENDEEDNGTIHFLENELVAELVAENEVNVKQFGAKGDNEQDDTSHFQNAINYSCANGYKKVIIPNGTYKITSQVSTPQDHKQPIIEGYNKETCIIDSSSVQNLIMLKIKGSSGRLCLSYISNLTFKGNNTNTGIELQGICGYKIKNCFFDNLELGVLLHNATEQEFTELDVIENCDFLGSCSKALVYRTSNGVESFNGSGLKNCSINQSGEELNPKIIIENGCLVYNAPMDFEIWLRNNNTPIISKVSDKPITIKGNIRIECLVEANKYYIVDQNNQDVILQGDVTIFGGQVSTNKLKFVNSIKINPNRTITAIENSNNLYKILNVENNVIPEIYLGPGVAFLINIYLSANGYEEHSTYLCGGKKSSDEMYTTLLACHEHFNTSNFVQTTVTNNGRNLTINNPSFNGQQVNCYIGITPLSCWSEYSFG